MQQIVVGSGLSRTSLTRQVSPPTVVGPAATVRMFPKQHPVSRSVVSFGQIFVDHHVSGNRTSFIRTMVGNVGELEKVRSRAHGTVPQFKKHGLEVPSKSEHVPLVMSIIAEHRDVYDEAKGKTVPKAPFAKAKDKPKAKGVAKEAPKRVLALLHASPRAKVDEGMSMKFANRLAPSAAPRIGVAPFPQGICEGDRVQHMESEDFGTVLRIFSVAILAQGATFWLRLPH